MKGNYEEYRKTIHYSNRTGVRATCPDCHVPKEFVPKMLRKFEARNDVWAHLTGKVDTPEKFEANRKAMAEREWARMKALDSATCRRSPAVAVFALLALAVITTPAGAAPQSGADTAKPVALPAGHVPITVADIRLTRKGRVLEAIDAQTYTFRLRMTRKRYGLPPTRPTLPGAPSSTIPMAWRWATSTASR